MNKTISIIRIAVLFVTFSFGIILLFGKEQDSGTLAFLLHVCMDKALALAAFICVHRLYKRWSKVDPIIARYDKMCNEVMDAPNPACTGNDSEE